MALLQLGDKIDRFLHGELVAIMEVDRVTETLAYVSSRNGYVGVLHREYDGDRITSAEPAGDGGLIHTGHPPAHFFDEASRKKFYDKVRELEA